MWNLRVKYSSIFETHRVKQNKTDFLIAGLSLKVFNSSVSVHSEFPRQVQCFPRLFEEENSFWLTFRE